MTLQSRGARDVCDLLYSREDTCVTSQSRGHVCDVSDAMASPRSVFTVIRTRVFNHSTVTMDTCDVMGHVTTLMIHIMVTCHGADRSHVPSYDGCIINQNTI